MVIGEFGVTGDLAGEVQDYYLCGFAEGGGALLVRRVGPQRSANHRPARRQWPPRPPDVQRRDVAVADGLFPPRMGGDALDGQVHFDEAFGVGHA